MDEVARACCPLCGGEIIVSEYYQKSYDYKVLKNGKMSKRYIVTDTGSMSARTAACGSLCGAYWEEDDFDIAEDGTFYDKKYTKMEGDT
nr:MAG TPA: Rad50 zinc hook motif [Caudoviricetes sp.]